MATSVIVNSMHSKSSPSGPCVIVGAASLLSLSAGALATPVMSGRPAAAAAESAPLSGTTAAPGSAPATQRPQGAFGPEFLILMVGLMVFMFVMTAMSGRKEKRRRAELLASIQRHDRVQTVGGVIGTVVDVQDDEIVLKVDESTNTRIRFARSSVQQVLKKSSDSRSESAEPVAASV